MVVKLKIVSGAICEDMEERIGFREDISPQSERTGYGRRERAGEKARKQQRLRKSPVTPPSN